MSEQTFGKREYHVTESEDVTFH